MLSSIKNFKEGRKIKEIINEFKSIKKKSDYGDALETPPIKSNIFRMTTSRFLKYYEKKGKVDDIPSATFKIIRGLGSENAEALDVFSCAISYIASKSIGGDWVERVVSMTVEAFDVMSRAEEKVTAKCVEALIDSGKSNPEILKFLCEIIKLRLDVKDKIIEGLVLACKPSEFSNLFLEIIKVNPAPKNIKLCMKAVVESTLKYYGDPYTYISNILKEAIRGLVANSLTPNKQIEINPVDLFCSIFLETLDVMPEAEAEDKLVSNRVEALRCSGKSNPEILKFLCEIIELRLDVKDKIIEGLVLACKPSEFSNLFLEIIKVNPAPENVKLCMRAVAESTKRHHKDPDKYISNILKEAIKDLVANSLTPNKQIEDLFCSIFLETLNAMPGAEEKVTAKCVKALRYSGKSHPEIAKILHKIIELKPDLIYKIIKGLVLTCKLSEFSNLFLEIIKVNPAPENVKLCMEALVKYALKHNLDSDYISNPLKKIIKYCEGKGNEFFDNFIFNFPTVVGSVFSQYLSKGRSKEEFYELLSSLIVLEIEAPDLNFKYINSIMFGLYFACEGRSDININSLLLGSFINNPECLEEIVAPYIYYGDYKNVKILFNIAIGGISYELLPSFMIRITKILESQVSNDEKYKIFANLIEDNPGRAIYVMQGVTSYYYIDNSSEDMDKLYERILKVFEQQREEKNRKLTVGGAVAYMMSKGKTDEIYNFLLHAARETKDTEKLADITLGVGLGLRESKTDSIDNLTKLLSKLNNNEEPKIPNIEDFNLMNIITIANIVLRDTLSKDNIEELTSIIDEIYSGAPERDKKILNAKRLALYIVLNKYFYMWLINKTGVSEETEKAILDLFNKVFERKYDRLSQIKFSEFGSLSYPYCKIKFRTFGVSGGYSDEVFSKIILDRKTADDDEIGNKIKPEDFKNVSLINIKEKFRGYTGTITNEELFKKIGLKKEDFGRKSSGEKSFKIFIDISFEHSYIVVIDTSIPWDDAIGGKVDCIAIIDSSNFIKEMCDEKKIMPNNFIELFSNIKTINDPFQQNGTCYMHALCIVSAISSKCTTFEDILGGFGHQIKNGKIVEKENSEFKPLQNEIIGEALFSYSPSLPEECKDAEESTAAASSTSSGNTSDEKYEELSIEILGKGGYTEIKESNRFVKNPEVVNTLEQLSERTSKYKNEKDVLSIGEARILRIRKEREEYESKEAELSEEGKTPSEMWKLYLLGRTSDGELASVRL